MRTIRLISVSLLLIAIGWGLHQFAWPEIVKAGLPTFLQKSSPTIPMNTSTIPKNVACEKIITPARNPNTGEIKEFPTSCSVPENWEPIQNDVPSLDLDIQ